MLQDVIIPTMVVSRRCSSGEVRESEVLNQSQIYITTAGYKNTFSYDKLIQLLVRMVIKPDRDSFVLGSSWRIPVLYGLQPKTFLQDLKNDSTFNEASFEREYESRWTGVVDDAFFDGDKFDKCRKLNQPELEETARKGSNGTAYYVIGADFARKGDQSEFSIIKVMPQPSGRAHKNLVNVISLEKTGYKQQAIVLKKLFYKYKARKIILDANGPGLGFVEFMLDTQVLPDGSILPPFGVENDLNGDYKGFRTDDMEVDAMYLVTANAAFNTECHVNLQSSISSGTVKFLISARNAKEKLLATKRGQAMNDEERAEYLKPFTATDILREQLMNLREEREGINIILKQANRKIKKDKVSSLEYALYWIKQEEDMKARRRKKFKASDWMLMN